MLFHYLRDISIVLRFSLSYTGKWALWICARPRQWLCCCSVLCVMNQRQTWLSVSVLSSHRLLLISAYPRQRLCCCIALLCDESAANTAVSVYTVIPSSFGSSPPALKPHPILKTINRAIRNTNKCRPYHISGNATRWHGTRNCTLRPHKSR